ncbi:MAG: cyclic nucleotide-binding domain-containing protein [Opitutaceae bacterium]
MPKDGSPAAIEGMGKAIPPELMAKGKLSQRDLFSFAAFRLAAGCKVTTYDKDRVIVKYVPGRGYLTLNAMQWKALGLFEAQELMVPQVLFKLIYDRRCPPLREFYEVVIKAFESGILQVRGHEPPAAAPAFEWKAAISGRRVRALMVVACVAVVAAQCYRPFHLPGGILELLFGWLLAAVGLSAGDALAACVVRGANAEVYHPVFHWKTLLPRFTIECDDAVMGGRQAEFDAGLARIAPLLVLMAVAPLVAPGVGYLLAATFVLQLTPFWRSPGLTMLRAKFSTPPLDAFRRFRFEPNCMLWTSLRTRLRHVDSHFLRAHAIYTGVWLVLVLLMGLLPLGGSAQDLWEGYVRSKGLYFTGCAMLALLGILVLGVLATSGWLAWGWTRRVWDDFQQKRQRMRPVKISPEEIATTLGESLLFLDFSPEDRALVAAALRSEQHAKNSLIVKQWDLGDRLFIVHSGRVEILHDTAAGRLEAVAALDRGEVFGEIALLGDGRRTCSVRAQGEVVLLSLTRADFEQLVLSKLGRDQVIAIIQKAAFLQRLPLASKWGAHALISFARRASLSSYNEGDILIRQGDDNKFFFVLYEGELSVQVGRAEVARLHTGDFFGEIGALQNSVATATIVALTGARCLMLAKREFLQFVVSDFVIGMQFEQISSNRLGRPLFPLKAGSFDTLGA